MAFGASSCTAFCTASPASDGGGEKKLFRPRDWISRDFKDEEDDEENDEEDVDDETGELLKHIDLHPNFAKGWLVDVAGTQY